MATPQLDRLKSQLLASGLQQRDNPTWQVINQLIDFLRQANIAITVLEENGGGSGDGITELTTDVVAVGPGVAVATIQPLAVTTGKIDNLAVTDAKLAADSVITVKILDANVTTPKIADLNVTTGKLADDAVTTPKILDANVTNQKLDDTAVTPGTYGDSTHVGQFTVNQKGRITAASNVAIAFGPAGAIYEPLMTGKPAWGEASDSELVLDSDGDVIMVPMP